MQCDFWTNYTPNFSGVSLTAEGILGFFFGCSLVKTNLLIGEVLLKKQQF